MSSKTKTAGTKDEATPALVPKLRFPEFRGAEAWLPYLLEELEDLGWVELGRGEVISGQDIKAIPGDYPIYSSSVKNNGLMGVYGRFMFDEELISWSVDGGGDFFHRPRHKFSVTNVSGYMRLNTSHLNYRFLASHLQALHASLTFDYQFKAHPSVIRKLYRLAIPSPAEQQKIAECLSSVDELMAAQARKLDALKTHKKGLMQQLFPREGETQPRLRFPEFQAAGEWEIEPLGDLGEIVTGKTPSTKESELWGGDILFITPTDISEDDKYQHTAARTVVETKSTKILPAGSVVYTCIASIGKMALTAHPSITNQQINAVVPNEKVLGEFIYYALANLTPWIKTIPATNTLPIINKTDFSKIAIFLPEGKAEQQRIAECLTSLDDLIAAQTQKLAALKTHKKGLMQQLFPSPAAVEA